MPIARHDLTHSPVGLWQLDGDLLDSSGNGYGLSTNGSWEQYSFLFPDMRGFFMRDDLVNNQVPARRSGTAYTYDAGLAITGDITIEALIRPDAQTAGLDQIIAAFSGYQGSSTEANNCLYAFGFQASETPSELQPWYYSESGAGVASTYLGPTNMFSTTIQHVAMRRQSDVISFFQNGRLLATSGTLTTPTGGTSGGFSIGGMMVSSTGNSASAHDGNAVMASVKVIASALSDAQILAEYNRTLGGVFPRVSP